MALRNHARSTARHLSVIVEEGSRGVLPDALEQAVLGPGRGVAIAGQVRAGALSGSRLSQPCLSSGAHAAASRTCWDCRLASAPASILDASSNSSLAALTLHTAAHRRLHRGGSAGRSSALHTWRPGLASGAAWKTGTATSRRHSALWAPPGSPGWCWGSPSQQIGRRHSARVQAPVQDTAKGQPAELRSGASRVRAAHLDALCCRRAGRLCQGGRQVRRHSSYVLLHDSRRSAWWLQGPGELAATRAHALYRPMKELTGSRTKSAGEKLSCLPSPYSCSTQRGSQPRASVAATTGGPGSCVVQLSQLSWSLSTEQQPAVYLCQEGLPRGRAEQPAAALQPGLVALQGSHGVAQLLYLLVHLQALRLHSNESVAEHRRSPAHVSGQLAFMRSRFFLLLSRFLASRASCAESPDSDEEPLLRLLGCAEGAASSGCGDSRAVSQSTSSSGIASSFIWSLRSF